MSLISEVEEAEQRGQNSEEEAYTFFFEVKEEAYIGGQEDVKIRVTLLAAIATDIIGHRPPEDGVDVDR